MDGLSRMMERALRNAQGLPRVLHFRFRPNVQFDCTELWEDNYLRGLVRHERDGTYQALNVENGRRVYMGGDLLTAKALLKEDVLLADAVDRLGGEYGPKTKR